MPLFMIVPNTDGHLFATCRQPTVQIWSTDTQQPLGQPLVLRSRPNSVAFANRDSALAISCDDGSIGLWDFRTGKERVRLQGPTGFSAVSQVSPDGSTLAGSTAPGTIALWNCDSGTKRTVAPLFDSSKVTILRFSASGEFLAVGTDDGMISLWQTQAGRVVWKRKLSPWPVQNVCFAKHSPKLAVQSGRDLRRLLAVVRIETGDLVVEPIELQVLVRSVNWVGEVDELATATADGLLRLWRTETDNASFAIPHHSQVVCSAVTPDRHILATVDGDGNCCLTHLATGQAPTPPKIDTLRTNPTGTPRAVAISGEGDRLALADPNSHVLLFDLKAGRLLRGLKPAPPFSKWLFPIGISTCSPSRNRDT